MTSGCAGLPVSHPSCSSLTVLLPSRLFYAVTRRRAWRPGAADAEEDHEKIRTREAIETLSPQAARARAAACRERGAGAPPEGRAGRIGRRRGFRVRLGPIERAETAISQFFRFSPFQTRYMLWSDWAWRSGLRRGRADGEEGRLKEEGDGKGGGGKAGDSSRGRRTCPARFAEIGRTPPARRREIGA